MIALFPNSILNTFLSGRVRPIFGKFEFRSATFEPGTKKTLPIKKSVYLFHLSQHVTVSLFKQLSPGNPNIANFHFSFHLIGQIFPINSLRPDHSHFLPSVFLHEVAERDRLVSVGRTDPEQVGVLGFLR